MAASLSSSVVSAAGAGLGGLGGIAGGMGAGTGAGPSAAAERLVAESAWDLLYLELVATERRLFRTDTDTDAAYNKLELLGYRVGYGLAEKATRERTRFVDTLDVIKFLCKDVWIATFKKQIDNLKTNHRGVYVLTDNSFRWLTRMASDGHTTNDAVKAIIADHLAFPCGLVRGVLANFGIPTTVTAEATSLPQCTFQIKMVKQ
ncbi:NO signaling/Golgi transport ligand-binding domain-containing protein [Entophlyctis helioformis]|nr:NO signaling/Golgi transport ligand-binding domain-containing protein [Entophlyctis helioformis]